MGTGPTKEVSEEVQEILDKCESEKKDSLRLSGHKLTTLPVQILTFDWVTSLTLSSTHLDPPVDEVLYKLTNLQRLLLGTGKPFRPLLPSVILQNLSPLLLTQAQQQTV
jgi:hypothetical protein